MDQQRTVQRVRRADRTGQERNQTPLLLDHAFYQDMPGNEGRVCDEFRNDQHGSAIASLADRWRSVS